MDEDEATIPEKLRDLAERLRHVPGSYGIDDGDIDELIFLARDLETKIFVPLDFLVERIPA